MSIVFGLTFLSQYYVEVLHLIPTILNVCCFTEDNLDRIVLVPLLWRELFPSSRGKGLRAKSMSALPPPTPPPHTYTHSLHPVHARLPIQGSRDRTPASRVFRIRLKTEVPSPYDLVVGETLNPSSLTRRQPYMPLRVTRQIAFTKMPIGCRNMSIMNPIWYTQDPFEM